MITKNKKWIIPGIKLKNSIMLNILNISHTASDLIFYFKYFNDESKSTEEIISQLKNLSLYEYLFVINETLKSTEKIDLPLLQTFFGFEYEDYHGNLTTEKAKENNVIKSIYTINSSLFKNIELLEPKEQVILIFQIKNILYPKIVELKFEIQKRLSFFKKTNDIRIISREIDQTLEDYLNFHHQNIYKEIDFSLFDKISENIFQDYYNGIELELDYYYDTNINTSLERTEKLHKLYKSNNHIYNFLLNGAENWKKQISKDLLQDKNSFEFKKNFYIESLNQFQIRTKQNFLKQYRIQSNIKSETNPYLINKLVNWIKETFPNFNSVQHLDTISIIEELPSKRRIMLSNDFSHQKLIDINIKFLKSIKVEVDFQKIEKIKSFISNFTIFEEKPHYKKTIDKTPFQGIDFIPNTYFKDYFRIYLKLHSKGKIKGKISEIHHLFSDLYYNEESGQGLSYETLRKISDFNNFDKKFENLKGYLNIV